MVSGKRNRAAGHGWERELAEQFRKLGFPHVVTSRSESRARDAQKVDLINKDERINGQFVFNIQAKNVKGHLRYAKLLGELPRFEGVINVVAHKQTEKVNERFLPKGKYAIMEFGDFEKIVKIIQSLSGNSFNPALVLRA